MQDTTAEQLAYERKENAKRTALKIANVLVTIAILWAVVVCMGAAGVFHHSLNCTTITTHDDYHTTTTTRCN